MDREALRTLIRAKLRDGRLPVNNVSRLFGGPGNGEICDACDAVITKEQLGIEESSLAGGGGSPLQVHAGCFQIWDAERRTRSCERTA
jgi:hypothetical protein